MLYPLSYEGIPLYVRFGYRASVGSSGSGWLPRSRRSVPRAVTRPLAIHPDVRCRLYGWWCGTSSQGWGQ